MPEIQLVRRTKPRPITFIRAVPYTKYHPTIYQIKHRLRLAEVAKKYKGSKGFEDGLPVIAAKIKKELSGTTVGRKVKRTKLDIMLENEASLRLIALKYRIARAVAQVKLRGLA